MLFFGWLVVWLVLWHINPCRLINAKSFLFMGRVFADGPRDRGSISGRVIPKTQKMVLDATLLNTQHYKVRIMGKVAQSRE